MDGDSEENFCSDCSMKVPGRKLLEHLENFHTGRRPVEEVRIGCGGCLFRVSVEKIQDMIQHAFITGHDPSTLKICWGDYIKIEENRLREIVRMGIRLKSSPQSPKNVVLGSEAGTASAVVRNELNNKVQRNPQLKRSLPNIAESNSSPKVIRSSAEEHHSSTSHPNETETQNKEEKSKARRVPNRNFELDPKASSGRLINVFPHASETGKKADYGGSLNEPVSSSISEPHQQLSSPPSSTSKKKSERGTQRACQLCGRRIIVSSKSVVTHALSHDPSIRLFQCGNCDYRTVKKHNIQNHTFSRIAKEMGCTGTWISIATLETATRIRELLAQSFPDVVWNGTFDGIDYNNVVSFASSSGAGNISQDFSHIPIRDSPESTNLSGLQIHPHIVTPLQRSMVPTLRDNSDTGFEIDVMNAQTREQIQNTNTQYNSNCDSIHSSEPDHIPVTSFKTETVDESDFRNPNFNRSTM